MDDSKSDGHMNQNTDSENGPSVNEGNTDNSHPDKPSSSATSNTENNGIHETSDISLHHTTPSEQPNHDSNSPHEDHPMNLGDDDIADAIQTGVSNTETNQQASTELNNTIDVEMKDADIIEDTDMS